MDDDAKNDPVAAIEAMVDLVRALVAKGGADADTELLNLTPMLAEELGSHTRALVEMSAKLGDLTRELSQLAAVAASQTERLAAIEVYVDELDELLAGTEFDHVPERLSRMVTP